MKESRTSSAHQRLPEADGRAFSARSAMAVANVLARCWLVVHLVVVAGITTALHGRAPPALLAGWSLFVTLNVLLHLGMRRRYCQPDERLQTAMAAMLGLAWGGGAGLFLAYVDSVALAALLSGVLAIALFAIPVFGEYGHAYTYFLSTLGLLLLGAMLRDGHFVNVTLWVAMAMATLQLLASVYFRTHHALRDALAYTLDLNPLAAHSTRGYPAQLLDQVTRRRAEICSRLAREARQRQTLDSLGDGVLTCDASGTIDYVSSAVTSLLGVEHDQLVGQPLEQWVRIVYGRDPHNRTRDIFDAARRLRTPQAQSDQPQLLRRDGVSCGVDYRMTPLFDELAQFAGVSLQLRDMTRRRQHVQAVAWQASHDALTGVINRREFEHRVHKLLQGVDGAQTNDHTLLYIDIDKFKFINDTYGHAAGDHALRTLTAILRTRIRGADTLARIGGDEFCALLYSCNVDRAQAIGESLRGAIDSHVFTWEAIRLPVSVSIGLVEIGPDLRTTTDLLQAADAACYSAKRHGRNRVQMFESADGDKDQQDQQLDGAREIQRALHDGHLDLFYQPLCATVATFPSIHCEVSAAIRTVNGGVLLQRDVVALAARYQFSADIDRWLIKASIEALSSAHSSLHDMHLVLIPLAVQSFSDEHLLEFAIRTVRAHKHLASRIGFTLPESVLVGQPDLVRYFVTTMKQDGCQFLISDLGFGGAAIEAIKSMQIDYLGIRGCFVRSMLGSSVDYEVVLGLSRVARALGMHTVAEHADSHALRDALAKMGIDFAKGLLHDGPRLVTHSEPRLPGNCGTDLA